MEIKNKIRKVIQKSPSWKIEEKIVCVKAMLQHEKERG